MAFNVIQLVLSVIVICIGLAALGGTAGKAIFAVGGLWLINTVRLMWHGKGASSIVQFEKGAASIEDLDTPKQITLTAVNPMMNENYSVFLNNENIGSVTYSQPLTFSVTKQRNVLHISQWHRNPCFF